MKTHRCFFTVIFLMLAFSLTHWIFGSPTAAQRQSNSTVTPKYIFLFLADGAGIAHMEITRQYNRVVHNEGLVIVDRIMKEGTLGLVRNAPADVSVPKTDMEIAKENGMRVGLVTNAAVYDASPAAFVNHVPNRRNYAAILNRYLEMAPDLLFGGGKEQFLPKSQPGSRRNDDIDLIAAFIKK